MSEREVFVTEEGAEKLLACLGIVEALAKMRWLTCPFCGSKDWYEHKPGCLYVWAQRVMGDE